MKTKEMNISIFVAFLLINVSSAFSQTLSMGRLVGPIVQSTGAGSSFVSQKDAEQAAKNDCDTGLADIAAVEHDGCALENTVYTQMDCKPEGSCHKCTVACSARCVDTLAQPDFINSPSN